MNAAIIAKQILLLKERHAEERRALAATQRVELMRLEEALRARAFKEPPPVGARVRLITQLLVGVVVSYPTSIDSARGPGEGVFVRWDALGTVGEPVWSDLEPE